MALDLFLNFERQSNGSLFFRETSASDYTVFIKLSDQSTDNFGLTASNNYIAQYSINNSANKFSYNFPTGAVMTFERTVPCVSSVQVFLSAADKTFLQKYELSAAFIDEFPIADFIVYPSSYFNEISSTLNYLSASNYFESPGVYFYGEGHTEVLNLSTSSTTNEISAVWIVGNGYTESSYPISAIDLYTAIASVSSYSNQSEVIPISLRLVTEAIPINGSVIKYDDVTGSAEYYSFFDSTMTVAGSSLSSSNVKDSLTIKPYPIISQYKYNSPFSNLTRFNLPYDYSNQQFSASVEKLGLSSILLEYLDETTWELDVTSRDGDWNLSKTLQEIYVYNFPLAYDPSLGYTPSLLKCSPKEDTTVTQLVTAKKIIQIDYPPYDWLENTQTETFSSQATIISIPYIKLYLPNYLHLRNEDVVIRSIETYSSPDFVLKQVIVQPEDGQTVTLSGIQLEESFTVSFEKLGTKTLSAYCTFYNQSIEQNQTVINIFPDAVKIVEEYDVVDLDSYRSEFTPLTLSLSSAPLISPNEWVTDNNINSVFDKLYTTVDQINDYTNIYNKTNKFYGWLGNPIYSWSDLECPPNQSSEVAWKQHELCIEPNATAGYPIFWIEHECEKQVGDPSCLQKYCIEWKWKTRKRSTSDILTTWKDTKKENQYAKKWQFEVCEVDNELLNCDKGKWHISTMDPDYFPIPFCVEKPRCAVKGAIELADGSLVVAHATELNLLDNTYQSTLVARRGIADEIFAFVNIEALAISKTNKLFVLDSTIPRICIFEVIDNSFRYYNSWGRFGVKTSLYGFNKPKDIHINQHDEILITDSGNKCIKKYTSAGKHLQTIDTEIFETSEPLSVCQDSNNNIHILFNTKVIVVNLSGIVLYEYVLSNTITQPNKINTSFNRELIYITYKNGVSKYFKNGTFFEFVLTDFKCADGAVLTGFSSLYQDSHRNLIISVEDKLLKVVDHMEISLTRSPFLSGLYWQKQDVLIHKEEYVQPWVYLKSFHRLWDNIELLRNSLFYEASGCKTYTAPLYTKEDLVIGQNEIVTNATINRLSNQLWNNIQTLTKYFDINCKN